MPALQVRDFPDDLYEKLKIHAADNNRSIAQQTIVAVKEMMSAENNSRIEQPSSNGEALLQSFNFDTEAKRVARIKRKKAIFAEMRRIEWQGMKPAGEDIVKLVREGHEKRDESILHSVGFFGELNQVGEQE